MISQSVNQIKISSTALIETDIWTLSDSQRQAVATIVRYAQELDNVTRAMASMTPECLRKYIRHDCLNLLTPLLGYAEMLREGWIGALDQQQLSLVEGIARAAYDLRDHLRRRAENGDYSVALS